MSASSYLLAVAVYLGVVGILARVYDVGRTLGFRDVLGIVIWPLDLMWPFLIAVVAALELYVLFAAERVRSLQPGQRATEPS